MFQSSMENESNIASDEPTDLYQYDCHPVLTVTTLPTDSQTVCGREDIFARFLCKYDVDLEDDGNVDNKELTCISSTNLCTRNHWTPNDCGRGKFWVNDNVIGDGNCFFRSLSKALTGVEKFHPVLRFVIVDHMRDHKDIYRCLIDGDIDAHMEHMRNSNGGVWTWATEAEVKAAADVLECDIYVRQQVGHNTCWCLFKSGETIERFENYFLTIIYERHHFDLGRMVNHGCNCQLTRDDVSNWVADVNHTSDTNSIHKSEKYITLWKKHNRNIKCSWNSILKNKEALELYLTITLHLPLSMTSLPVFDIYVFLYEGNVYVRDMVNSKIWNIILLTGNTISIGSHNVPTQKHANTDICKRVATSEAIEVSPTITFMCSVFFRLWRTISRRRQIELLSSLLRNSNIRNGYTCTLVVHSEDLTNYCK